MENILKDNRQDPLQSYKILDEFYGILISSGKDPTVLQTRSFEIPQDPTVSKTILYHCRGSYGMRMGTYKSMKGLHSTGSWTVG